VGWLWDLRARRKPQPLPPAEGSVLTCAAFSPDGDHLVTAGWDPKRRRGEARLWALGEPGKASQAGKPIPLRAPATHAAFSPRGDRLVTATGEKGVNRGEALVWEVPSGEPVKALVAPGQACAHREAVLYAEFSRDGRRVVTASVDDTARVWDLAGDTSVELKGHSADVIHAS